jgi:transposase
MIIIGCDYHPGFQQIAFVDTETCECGERRLTHREEAEQFYDTLKERRVRVWDRSQRTHARWFERLLNELQFELCRASGPRKLMKVAQSVFSIGCAGMEN